ncbi:MAG: ABC transporter ATP-binding protein [Acidobacteria bacterium]|nr:ABC transporter ATP-binding protein [Acidobacteriota bacterium]
MSAISVSGLRMHYGGVEAVRGVDLTIEEGEVFALLGPNGAGKTTIVEILEGYRKRTAGDVDVLGFDPERNERDFKERIGIVLQESSVERELTVAETIETYGRYYPERLETGELIDIVGLREKADARVKTLSGGQKRRLEVALGIVGNPDLVFLDEPTTGFDPAARRQAWGMIRNLSQLGKTILLTTHYMDEAQNLADRLAVIDRGKIVAEGTPDTIGGRRSAGTTIRFDARGLPVDAIPLNHVAVAEGIVEVSTENPTRDLHALTAWAVAGGHTLEDLTVTRPSLEDVYLELTDEGTEG